MSQLNIQWRNVHATTFPSYARKGVIRFLKIHFNTEENDSITSRVYHVHGEILIQEQKRMIARGNFNLSNRRGRGGNNFIFSSHSTHIQRFLLQSRRCAHTSGNSDGAWQGGANGPAKPFPTRSSHAFFPLLFVGWWQRNKGKSFSNNCLLLSSSGENCREMGIEKESWRTTACLPASLKVVFSFQS